MRSIHRYLHPALALAMSGACLAGPEIAVDSAPGSSPACAREPASAARSVYDIDPETSHADILVGKQGLLRRFGHEHVVVARPARGHVVIAEDLPESCAWLLIEVASLQVDGAEARARHGLPAGPNTRDVQGTRTNMLERVLQAAQWPEIHVRIEWQDGALPAPAVTAWIDLHGVSRAIGMPVRVEEQEDALHISGTYEMLQTDFDIRPFKAAAGSLRVADSLQITFELFANRLKVQQ